MANFKRKPGITPVIPSASMSDIVFTLLLFFMCVTVIKKYSGLPVNTPEAWKSEKLTSKTHVSFIWLDETEQIIFDDYPISQLDDMYTIAREKIEKDVQLVVFMRIDRNTKMGMVNEIQSRLRQAGALRVIYATKSKSSPIY
jgi:biopolymer transport protein ExbD